MDEENFTGVINSVGSMCCRFSMEHRGKGAFIYSDGYPSGSLLIEAEDPPCGLRLFMFLREKPSESHIKTTGWWFGTCFIFPYIGKNPPN